MQFKDFKFCWERFIAIGAADWVVAGTLWATCLTLSVDWLAHNWLELSVVSVLSHGFIQLGWQIMPVPPATSMSLSLVIALLLSWILFLHIQRHLFVLWGLKARRSWLMSSIVYWFVLLIAGFVIAVQWALELWAVHMGAGLPGSYFWAIKVLSVLLGLVALIWIVYAVVGPRVFQQQKMLAMALAAGICTLLWLLLVCALSTGVSILFPWQWITNFMLVMLVWIGCLTIFYFAANIVYVRAKYGALKPTEGQSSDADFLIAYRLVGYMWWAQNSGRQLNEKALLNVMHEASEAQVFNVLNQLTAGNVIHKTQDAFWALSRDLSSMTMLELYRACPGMPGNWRTLSLHGDPWDEAIEPLLMEATDKIEEIWSVNLRELYSTAGPFISQQKD